MASGINFSMLANPALTTTADATVAVLRTYDRTYAAGVAGQAFSNAVLGEYYELCKTDGLVPISGPESTDPQWSEHHLHEFPGHRLAAVANIVDKIARAAPRPAIHTDVAALTVKIGHLESMVHQKEARISSLSGEIEHLKRRLEETSYNLEEKSRSAAETKAAFARESTRSSVLAAEVSMLRSQVASLSTELSRRGVIVHATGAAVPGAHVRVGEAATRRTHGGF